MSIRVHSWFLLLSALSSFLFATSAQAQWQNTTYDLKGGWNAIYLHGDASHATVDDLMASETEVLEVWRWNPNPTQVQFTASPLLPTPGTPDWSVWVRGGGANTLTSITGQAAYLVKCSGTMATNHSVVIMQKPMPPASTWVRNGANFLGFPSKQSGANFPSFSNYFATFPAAIAANTRIYKYIGGELSQSNPIQIFSPASEQVNRNTAYWFSSEVVGNFYAPVQVTLSMTTGLDFGRNGAVMTARVLNRTSSVMTLTLAPVVSNSSPGGQEPVTGAVPLTRRTFNTTTAQWEETLIAAAYTEVIAPQSAVELSFGIDRSAMTAGSAGALYASMLRLTDAGDLFDILIPATARKSSLAGLWMGEAQVTRVESKAEADQVTDVARPFPLRYVIHVSDSGTATLLSQVFVGQIDVPPYELGLCTREVDLYSPGKAEAMRITSAHLPLDLVLDGSASSGSGTFGPDQVLTRRITLPYDDPTNPFVHQYHPDHDNKTPTGAAITTPGIESHSIQREVSFQFDDVAPPGVTGWGASILTGSYAEVIQGLHKDSVGVGSGDGLHLQGTFELRRVSEIGTLITDAGLIGSD